MNLRRWRASALFFSVLLGSAGAIGSQPAQAQNASATFVPFYSFLRIVENAAPNDYVGRPGNLVSDAAAFSSMRQHILDMYGNAHVANSYALDEQVFDCIPIAEQPSVRLLGLTKIAPPPPNLPRPPGFVSPPPAPQIGPDQKVDAFGNSIGCADGFIPMRRITLEELSRFRTLREFFEKGPDGAGQFEPTPSVAVTHKYAVSTQAVTNYGAFTTINIWKPDIDTAKTEVFSLSQFWVTSYPNTPLQTVEGGWQAFPKKYKTAKSVLFIYWTADNYLTTGCYNLDCAAFVQTNKSVELGAGFPPNHCLDQVDDKCGYSVAGGKQYEFEFAAYLYEGNWWLAYEGLPIGYYPIGIYQGGPLTTVSAQIEFGGETLGATAWPPMGSGKFASAGLKHAAYQQTIYYVTDTSGDGAFANLTSLQLSPSCYTDAIFNNTSPGTYMYFGGPGGKDC